MTTIKIVCFQSWSTIEDRFERKIDQIENEAVRQVCQLQLSHITINKWIDYQQWDVWNLIGIFKALKVFNATI